MTWQPHKEVVKLHELYELGERQVYTKWLCDGTRTKVHKNSYLKCGGYSSSFRLWLRTGLAETFAGAICKKCSRIVHSMGLTGSGTDLHLATRPLK